MTHNFNSLVKFGLGLFMAGSASLMLVGCDKAPSGNSSSASQDHLARIKSAGELKVGLEGDWQPFSFHDEKDGTVIGIRRRKIIGFSSFRSNVHPVNHEVISSGIHARW